jgi:hypothetical protein
MVYCSYRDIDKGRFLYKEKNDLRSLLKQYKTYPNESVFIEDIPIIESPLTWNEQLDNLYLYRQLLQSDYRKQLTLNDFF